MIRALKYTVDQEGASEAYIKDAINVTKITITFCDETTKCLDEDIREIKANSNYLRIIGCKGNYMQVDTDKVNKEFNLEAIQSQLIFYLIHISSIFDIIDIDFNYGGFIFSSQKMDGRLEKCYFKFSGIDLRKSIFDHKYKESIEIYDGDKMYYVGINKRISVSLVYHNGMSNSNFIHETDTIIFSSIGYSAIAYDKTDPNRPRILVQNRSSKAWIDVIPIFPIEEVNAKRMFRNLVRDISEGYSFSITLEGRTYGHF